MVALPAAAVSGAPVAPVALAATSIDADAGRLVDRSRCELPFDTYEAWLDFIRERHAARSVPFDEAAFRVAYPRASFDRLHDGSIECWSITYRSDGLQVAAYIVRPRHATVRSLPAIIYNRGGNRDFGRLVFADVVEFAEWAQQGFVVLASQYRGSTGSEGSDEFGGADVNDVLNLFPLARSLGVDMRNVFMAGFSRGGMMTYLALKSGAPVNAAVVIGGPTDLALQAKHRPEMLRVYRALMPDFERRRTEHLRSRCALEFAGRFNAPLLILHGGADTRVPPEQALALAQRLLQLRKPFELVVYADDDHTLSNNVADSRERLVAWFKRHMK
jgi:dipeptidyl aminopeptidase/acylaminoacyl peptidase